MKRLVTASLLLVLLLAFSTAPALADSGEILIDGKHVQLASAPAVVSGVVMLPVRDVVEDLGGKVSWDAGAHKAVLQTPEHRVELMPGQAGAIIDSQRVPLTVPVTLQGGRLLAPASFLLALYGNRLRIVDPELVASPAVALLKQTKLPVNFDFNITALMSMQLTGRPLMPDPPAGVPLSREVVRVSADGFVRGHDALMRVWFQPPEPAMGKGDTMRLAVRNGHMYRFTDNWAEMPGQSEGLLPLDGTALLHMLKALREAHLGGTRVVEGHKLQDVVVTLDPSALGFEPAGQPAPGGAQPPVPEAPGKPALSRPGQMYQSMDFTVTLDVETHELRGFTMDVVQLEQEPSAGQNMGMYMAAHVAGTLAPDDTPMVWPRDLP